jgi:predicted component of type VI protein secretion system
MSLSDPRLINYESRMNRVDTQVEKSNLRKQKSKTLKFDGYESCSRKVLRLRKEKSAF